jgi:hypothetical protein
MFVKRREFGKLLSIVNQSRIPLIESFYLSRWYLEAKTV